MNWKEHQQQIYDLTLQDTQDINKQIIALYKQSITDINNQIATAYQKYLKSVGTIDYYNNMIIYNRLENMLKDVKASYLAYSAKAENLIENAVCISASNAYYRSIYASSWLLDGFTVNKIPYDLIELITYGTADAWKKIPQSLIDRYGSLANYQSKAGTLTEFILKNRADELFKLQNTITNGFRQGLTYENIANNVAGIIGGVTRSNGTLSASGAVANAMKLVRTEGTRAMNAASYVASKDVESTGVKIQKQWMCSLDDKTRSAHAHLDGKCINIDKKFKIGDDSALYPGGFGKVKNNINCRCTTIDIINDTQPELRHGTNPTSGEKEIFSFRDFDAWRKDNGLSVNKHGEIYE